MFYLNVSSESRPISLPTFKICSCNLNPVNPGPSENYHPQTNVSVIFLVDGCIVRHNLCGNTLERLQDSREASLARQQQVARQAGKHILHNFL